ncbi:AsmA-like C-terminal region-containing protein [Denitromonas iodatirespirans]|uniref:AsmA-like C-terminal domain-containing protein n=1 Tax=Denitromonas iodatirespirans TaxID=2795389 RepID=A0A944DMH5_DENI1|nr:AsmA-like C-terminal region-containing protein [Denitromonas iodatirespirans]MBT0961369.1 hypothetical protein [Denitromonas iodatirespirans]
MNFEDTVYVKTALGDARAKQPRSISSHELRATLLLIDGRITVREMKRRFGTSLAIDPAISELLREGLIQAREDRASEDEQASEDAVAEAVPAAALAEAGEASWGDPSPSVATPVDALPVDAADKVPMYDEPDPDLPMAEPEDVRVEPEASSIDIPVIEQDPHAPQEPRLDEAQDVAADKTPDPEPLLTVTPRMGDHTRGSVIAMGFFLERVWRGLLPAAAIVLIGALVVGAFLLPERYRGDLEAGMSAYLGTPVRFGSLRVSLAGGGALQMSDVRADALPSLRAGKVFLIPDWPASLRAVDWRFRVRIGELVGAPSALNRLMAAPADQLRVTETELDRVSVSVGGESWAVLSGSVMPGEQGAVANLRDELGTLTVTAIRAGDALHVDAVAVNRPLPVFPQIPVSTLQVVGTLSDDGFDITNFGAGVLDGKLAGTAYLSWPDGARIVADVTLSQVNVEQLLKRLDAGVRLGGSLSGRFKVEGGAAHPSEIRTASQLSGRFEVTNGVVGGMDFGAAMRERGSGKIQGGETLFESMTGELKRKDGALEVRVSRLQAGALDAAGVLRIGALEALSGQMTTSVGAGSRRVGLPVDIGGSLAAPTLEARLPAPPAPAARQESVSTDGGGDAESPAVSLEVPVAPGSLR